MKVPKEKMLKWLESERKWRKGELQGVLMSDIDEHYALLAKESVIITGIIKKIEKGRFK